MSESRESGTTYEGACFCGSVRLRVTGQPVAMGYCHCSSCRGWSAGPVNAFSLWKPESLRILEGEEQLDTFNKTERSYRRWCKTCGGHVYTDHPTFGLVDVYVALLPTLRFEPAMHVFYGEKVVRIADGLPKQQDMPKELGGSGVLLPE